MKRAFRPHSVVRNRRQNHGSFVTAIVAALVTWGFAEAADGGAAPATAPAKDYRPPMTKEGWIDLPALLVASDGTRRLGNHRARLNDSRDRGSKVVYFDPDKGDNASADVYWWDGKRIVDSAGRAANPANGKAYGTTPAPRASRPLVAAVWAGPLLPSAESWL